MNRARHWSLRALAALAGLALIAGCAHPTGYVDIRSVLTPLGEGRVTNAPLEQPLRITREVSERNAVLEVRVESLETTDGAGAAREVRQADLRSLAVVSSARSSCPSR